MCCQNTGSPPATGLKKLVPYKRSNWSSIRATVMTGNASTSRICTISDIHMKTGIFMNDMPGARKLMIVMMKLKAAARDATPRSCRPISQNVVLSPREYGTSVRLAYPNQPALGAALKAKLKLMKSPPERKSQ